MKITLDCVTKEYLYGKTALTAASLDISDGEIVAVLGNDGSGKTTLLNVLAGIEKVTGGKVLHDENEPDIKSGDIIMLFHDGALFKKWTVFDNLAYSLKIRKLSKAEIASKIMHAAESLNMVSLLDLKPRELNLYDRKKVSLARIFLRDCKAILIDDLGKGLDSSERKTLFCELKKCLLELKKTVVYTTTEPDEAAAISDRIVALHDGVIQQVGQAKDIYEKPNSVWAAELLDRNFSFSDAMLLEEGKTLTLSFEDKKLPLTIKKEQLLSQSFVGKIVLCGFHSEDLEENKDGLNLKTESVLGLLDGSFIVQFENGWRMKYLKKPPESVTVFPKANKVFLFDKASEVSILK